MGKARSGDIMKLWWTEAVGAKERGHLTIYLSQTENSLTFWSSNQSNPGGTPGYGTKPSPNQPSNTSSLPALPGRKLSQTLPISERIHGWAPS